MAALQEKRKVVVEPRADRGKGTCRRLRRSGRVPANVYGMDMPAYAVSVPLRSIDEVLHLGSGQNTVLTLTTGGDQSRDVMIRDLQRDPVSGAVIHVDFIRVDPNRTVTVQVPIRLLGLAEGVKNEGGILDFVHREIEVACLPSAIPEHIDVDVTALHVGQHVSVKDLTAAEGVRFLDEPDTIVATVSLAKAEVAVEAPAAEAVAAAAPAEGGETAAKGE